MKKKHINQSHETRRATQWILAGIPLGGGHWASSNKCKLAEYRNYFTLSDILMSCPPTIKCRCGHWPTGLVAIMRPYFMARPRGESRSTGQRYKCRHCCEGALGKNHAISKMRGFLFKIKAAAIECLLLSDVDRDIKF